MARTAPAAPLLDSSPEPAAPAVFRRLTPHTYSQEVARSIRAAIHDGTLPSGAPLVERRIAEEMGVSRAPVREALRQLEEEGLVLNLPFKGWYVTQVSPTAMAEIVSLRKVVEAFAAELALARVRRPDVQSFRRLYADMQRAATADDAEQLLEAHLTFHRALYELAGHGLLLQVWKTMEGQLRLYLRLHQLTYDTLPHYVKAHRPLLDAFASRDVEAVRAAIATHLGEHTDQLIH